MEKAITIASFESSAEADMLRQDLESAGVQAWLSDDATSVALWHVGPAIGGVKVQIREQDATVAEKLLGDRLRRRERNAESQPWYCGRCREWMSPSFDICWSCRGRRDVVEQAGSPQADAAFALQADRAEESDTRVQRAWRASILGWAVCPPIGIPPLAHLYSMYLLASTPSETLTSQMQQRKWLAGFSNLAACVLFVAFWTYICFSR